MYTPLTDMIRRAEDLDNRLRSGSLVGEALKTGGYDDRMTEMQREQLFAGERSDGQPLTPSISQDPFFKSQASAMRYAGRKRRKSAGFPGDSRRGLDTPNLYINGYFHSGFHVVWGSDEVSMENTNRVVGGRRRSQDLYVKYGKDAFGLKDENWNVILEDARPRLADLVRNLLLR